jgi:6-phosphofructokinase 1
MSVIGVLTAGGDCPGLNAVIRGITARGGAHGAEIVGIRDGWEGLMAGRTIALDRDAVRGILTRGGTVLGTSRMDPYVHGDGLTSCAATLQHNGIEKLIVIGGDGSLRSALQLHEEGLPIIGVPKTIDNDINGTDVTFGFDTAVQIATEAIDRLVTTAESHNRVVVVEVMGRKKGWIAVSAGIAGGADSILIPEQAYDLDEIAEILRKRHRRGQRYSIVVVAEGIDPPPGMESLELKQDAFGFERLGGVAYQVAQALEERTGFETRVSVLGHIQRGGTPTSFDRILATRLGVAATDLALDGASGVMVGVQGTEIVAVPLDEAVSGVRGVPPRLYDVAATFFG